METIKIDFKHKGKVFLNTKYIINFVISTDGSIISIVYLGGSERKSFRISEENCFNFNEIKTIVNNLK